LHAGIVYVPDCLGKKQRNPTTVLSLQVYGPYSRRSCSHMTLHLGYISLQCKTENCIECAKRSRCIKSSSTSG
jgi:hypothetical protein